MKTTIIAAMILISATAANAGVEKDFKCSTTTKVVGATVGVVTATAVAVSIPMGLALSTGGTLGMRAFMQPFLSNTTIPMSAGSLTTLAPLYGFIGGYIGCVTEYAWTDYNEQDLEVLEIN